MPRLGVPARLRLLATVAVFASGLGATLIALPPAAQAAAGFFPVCASLEQTDCIESATANGIATTPGPNGTVRDFPYLKDSTAAPSGLEFGAFHDSSGAGSGLGTDVDPSVTYRMVVRLSEVAPRELYGQVTEARFSVLNEFKPVRTLTLSFRPVPVNLRSGFRCAIENCGTAKTRANVTRTGFARGYLTTGTGIGYQGDTFDLLGVIHTSNAQTNRVRINYVNHTFVTEVANPRLRADGSRAPGTLEVLIPHRFAEYLLEMPDPRAATKSRFEVTRVAGKKNIPVAYSLTQESTGLRFRINGTTFPSSTYRIHPKVSAPGPARSGGSPVKMSATAVGVYGYFPYATGGTPINWYQARCRVIGGSTWYAATAARTAVAVSGLPRAAVAGNQIACQMRAHNAKGYGPFSKLEQMLPPGS